MYRNLFAIVAAAGLIGCALTPAEQARREVSDQREQARLDAALARLSPTGERSMCVSRATIRQTQLFDDAILFERSRDHLYRSAVAPGCGNDRDAILVFRNSTGSQYCSGDIVDLRDRSSGFPTGFCTLGEFVEYRGDAR